MKQVLVKNGKAVVENVPAPLIDENEILVEVAFSLISTGTEISGVESSGKSLINRALEEPEKIKKIVKFFKEQGFQKTVSKVRDKADEILQTGYSCSGIVLQTGSKIKDIKPGERVACAGAGIANHAEIVLVPKNLLVRIPEGCSLRDAASVTLGSIAMQGIRRADPKLGETIAVIGLGLLGQITIQLLNASGCRVVGIDLDPRRVEIAIKNGLDFGYVGNEVNIENEIRHLTEDHGVDATIITASSESDSIVQQAMEITRKKGRVVVVGAVGLGLKRAPFYEKEIDFLISCSYGPGRYDENYEQKGLDYPYAYVRWTEKRNMEAYLQLIAEGKVRLQDIFEREYPIEEASSAYGALMTDEEKPLAVLLNYDLREENLSKKLETKVEFNFHKKTGLINVALIGAGNFAKAVHLPNIKRLSDYYHLRAIVSGTGSNARITAERFGADYASTDYEQVLADETIDMVMICTRHNLHAPMAIKAAKAGKAIFLEKPMALNHSELDDLVNVLEDTKVPFMVGFNRRFSPAMIRAKEILQGRQNPVMIYYRMNAGYIPKEHWTQTEEGGGRIIGEACHIFDLFQYLVDAPAVEINSNAINPKNGYLLAEDNTTNTILFADGSLATLLYTAQGSSDFGKEYMELFTDGKVLVMDDYKTMRVYGSRCRGWKSAVQDKGHRKELLIFAKYIVGEVVEPIQFSELISSAKISFMI